MNRFFLTRTLAIALVAGLALIVAGLAQAHDYRRGGLIVTHPWTRPTTASRPIASVYLRIENTNDQPDRLLAVTTPLTAKAELHQTTEDGGVMRMRPVEAVEVPANSTITLQPGGIHLMLVNINRRLEDGDRFKLTLKFERAGEIIVDVLVQIPRADGKDMH